jgi:hypothetical protein
MNGSEYDCTEKRNFYCTKEGEILNADDNRYEIYTFDTNAVYWEKDVAYDLS